MAGLLLAGCGETSEPPDVDWSQVPANQRTVIDDAVTAEDCGQMQTYFDGTEDTDLLEYLDWHMKQAGCY